MKKLISLLYLVTRTSLFAVFIIIHLSIGYFTHFTVKDPYLRKQKFSRLCRWITNLACQFFGVRIKILNEPPKDAPGLIVGNHLGFIDILASGSMRPMLFVTSKEMRETPVLGLITELAGCIFVERRSKLGVHGELQHLIKALKEGFNVCLYPEATSHNGDHVLPFKRTLMTAAAHAGVPIYPYVFNFISIEGQPFNLKNRDSVCWYGDIPFLQAMVSTFSLLYVEVEIKFLPPVFPKVDDDRALIANQVHKMISDEFRPVLKY